MRLRHEFSLEMWQCEISSRVMTNRRSVGAVVDIMEVAFTSQVTVMGWREGNPSH